MASVKEIVQKVETKEGTTFVFRGLLTSEDFKNKELLAVLQQFGFNPEQFEAMMMRTYANWSGDEIRTAYPPDNPVEDLVIRSSSTSDGKSIEVTEVKVHAHHTMKTRLEGRPGAIGFEATYMLTGEMTYSMLDEYTPVAAGVYVGSEKETKITLHSGDLLILPRKVARQIVHVGDQAEYTYISGPWTEDDLPIDIMR